ncbi:MAG: hypothetical protein HZC01_04405 [Candidatus Kerfeldbacteria bacterium]|nr:hypothetical protein [Candidatus Kerfeldbacteria bacterium]
MSSASFSQEHHDPRQRAVQLMPTCQLCAEPFIPKRISVLNQLGQIQLLHAQCTRCRTGMVLLLLNHEYGIGSVGLVTDLTERDVLHFSTNQPVSVDDVLEIAELLQSPSFLDSIFATEPPIPLPRPFSRNP